eukprot:342370_1
MEGYEPLKPLSKPAFHINSMVVCIGLLSSLLMFSISLYEWKCKQCKNRNKPNRNRHKNVAPKILYSSLAVLLISILVFTIYFIEFFWLRLLPPSSYNYDSFTFCNNFTPFLFISIWMLVYGIIHYFLIRLEHSFKGSALEYPSYFYVIMKVITVIVIIIAFVLVFVATDGLPYNVDTQEVSNDHPWLCRNGIKSDYKFFWIINNVLALLVLIGGNFMNWFLFMNRLNKLVELGLTHDDSFKAFYSKKRKRKATNEYEVSVPTRTPYESIGNEAECEITPIKEDVPAEYPETANVNAFGRESGAIRINSHSLTVGVANILDKAMAKRKNTEQEKEERKRRRGRERRFYTMIKRQSILTGMVSISGAIFMLFQITVDDGSTMLLLSVIVSIICVFLSFRFNIKCFDLWCGKVMEDCTCIEDRMERKIAQKMGLKQDTTLEVVQENDAHESHDLTDHDLR